MSADIKTVLPLEEDGENSAIRMFLSLYGGTNSVTTKRMRGHLASAGYEGCWPEWANEDQHLTKGGAQHWIRHLISLEAAPASSVSAQAVDAVSVPRELFDELIDMAQDEASAYHLSHKGYKPEQHAQRDKVISDARALQSQQSPVQASDAGRQG